MMYDVRESDDVTEAEDRYWRNVTKLVVFACLMTVVSWLVVTSLTGCASAGPVLDEQAKPGLYGLSLQGCIHLASQVDGGHAERNASYNSCAHNVDVIYGRTDGGL